RDGDAALAHHVLEVPEQERLARGLLGGRFDGAGDKDLVFAGGHLGPSERDEGRGHAGADLARMQTRAEPGAGEAEWVALFVVAAGDGVVGDLAPRGGPPRRLADQHLEGLDGDLLAGKADVRPGEAVPDLAGNQVAASTTARRVQGQAFRLMADGGDVVG